MATMVLDASVMASYVLGIKSTEAELSALMRGPFEFIAPDIWRAELANVFWKGIRAGHLSYGEALKMLPLANELISITVGSQELWASALTLAKEADHPVYDCLFVALAIMEDSMVVSYDLRLKAKFGVRVVLPGKVIS